MVITAQKAKALFDYALEKELIPINSKAQIFYSQQMLKNRLHALRDAFPSSTLHAIAIKTCPHPTVLRYIIEQGFGLEAASIEEVKLAASLGIAPHKIVFDSPVKTTEEINYCHEALPGMLLNANSLQELARYPILFNGKIGLRINPLTSSSSHPLLNVATLQSKFGVPINKRQEILQAAIKYTSISCLHLHIGSDVDNFDKNIRAIKQIVHLADEINTFRRQKSIATRIDTVDIGGGIKFSLEKNHKLSLSRFVAELGHIKGLSNYQLITEYGAFIHQHNSFAVSEIEYVINNHSTSPNLAYIHLGADLFTRKVYSSLPIHYPCSVWQKKVSQQTANYTIVGPLCFAGDILYPSIKLPVLSVGDQIVIHDIGANTWGMWSSHCSRTPPPFLFLPK